MIDRSFASVEHAHELARRAVPRAVLDFVDGGAGSEHTVRLNVEAINELYLRTKLGLPGVAPATAITVLGTPIDFPVLLAPCGLNTALHPDGELAVARAAASVGTAQIISTFSGYPYADVVDAAPRQPWFQLYMVGGRDGAAHIVDQVAELGIRSLVVTLDSMVVGNRERDLRHGVTIPMRRTVGNAVRFAPQLVSHPTWSMRMARRGFNFDPAFARPALTPSNNRGPVLSSPFVAVRYPTTWKDVAWLRERWDGKLTVKGILTGTDARVAVDNGADGVVVSNHGGRQLDGVVPTIRALPRVVAEVGNDCEVLVDGGFRRGTDIVKALALGARAVLIGRPYLWGLAAGGQRGVERVLELLRSDIQRTLALMGVESIADLDSDSLDLL